MYCFKCGNLLKENDKFCSKCGSSIKTKKKNNNTVIAILSVFGGLLITVFILTLNYYFSTANPKDDPVPNWMRESARNASDNAIAREEIKRLNKYYDTKFHLLGYSYYYRESDRTSELAAIYVYSDEYPQVYVSSCVGSHCLETNSYEEEIAAWKQKNKIYDIAKDLGINTNKFAIYVVEASSSSVYGELLVNDDISPDNIGKLLNEVKTRNDLSSVTFTVFFVERGNNRRYKKYINGRGVTDQWLNSEFGSYSKYEAHNDYGSDVKLELVYEKKK